MQIKSTLDNFTIPVTGGLSVSRTTEEERATVECTGDGITVRKKKQHSQKKISLTWKRVGILSKIILVIQLV